MFANTKSQDLARWNKSLDTYLDTWNKAIKKLEEHHEAKDRSPLTISMLTEVKKLLGNSQAAIVTEEFQGDPSCDFKLVTTNFIDRVFQDQGSVLNPIKSKDKIAFQEYAIGGELAPVVAMLRLYSMVEFEVPTLMYVLTIKSWLAMSENTVLVGAKWDDVEKSMNEVCDKINHISTERKVTERLFTSSWIQARRLITTAKNLEDATTKLQGLEGTVQGQGKQDKQVNDEAEKIIQALEESGRKYAETGRKLLTKDDADLCLSRLQSPDGENQSDKSSMASPGFMRSVLNVMSSPTTLDDKDAQALKASKTHYPKVRSYLLAQAASIEADISKVQALVNLYAREQQNDRRRYFTAAKQWQDAYAKEIDGLTNLQDPMNLKVYWQRDSRDERIMAVKDQEGSLWHALTSAVSQTAPTYCGTPRDEQEKQERDRKIANKDYAAEWRKQFVQYQRTVDKNQRLSHKWFSLGCTLITFGLGVLFSALMFGELSKAGAAILASNTPLAAGVLVSYAVICSFTLWRSNHLHQKNFVARKKINETLTGKTYEERSWWQWMTKRDLSIAQVEATAASAETVQGNASEVVENGQNNSVTANLDMGLTRGRYGADRGF